jgi:hypothetical protein
LTIEIIKDIVGNKYLTIKKSIFSNQWLKIVFNGGTVRIIMNSVKPVSGIESKNKKQIIEQE